MVRRNAATPLRAASRRDSTLRPRIRIGIRELELARDLRQVARYEERQGDRRVLVLGERSASARSTIETWLARHPEYSIRVEWRRDGVDRAGASRGEAWASQIVPAPMTFARVLWLSVLLPVWAVACSAARPSLDAPLREGDFAFLMAWGSGLHGFETLRLASDGRATLLHRNEDRWWLVKFRVPQTEVDALRAELDRVGYFSLKARYSIGAIDGDQWFVKVRVGQRRHAVYLDNEFPEPMEELSNYVRTHLLGYARKAELPPDTVDYETASEAEPRSAGDVP